MRSEDHTSCISSQWSGFAWIQLDKAGISQEQEHYNPVQCRKPGDQSKERAVSKVETKVQGSSLVCPSKSSFQQDLWVR